MALHDDVKVANRRGKEILSSTPRAIGAYYDKRTGRIVVQLNTKLDVAFRPQDAQGLADARPSQLEPIEISPSGLGIHFPKLDADIYIPALLEGFLGSKRWIAGQLGKVGGLSKSPTKVAAAKRNGQLGGRPRRKTAAA